MKPKGRFSKNEMSLNSYLLSFGLLIVSCLWRGVPAQQMPSLLLGNNAHHQQHDTNNGNNYKNKVCDRYTEYRDGQQDLSTVLRGLDISVAARATAVFRLDENGALDSEYPGLIPDILDEVSRRGEFQWRNSFGLLTKADNMTFDDLLDVGAQTVDISAGTWSMTVERMKKGYSFSEMLDQTTILVTLKEEETTTLNFWNWTLPFQPLVWLSIIGTIMLSTLVYLLLEKMGNKRQKEEKTMDKWVTDNMYHSSLMFTGNMVYEPSTTATKIFVTSFSLWSLFITAAYTANLASFLVIRNTPGIEINSLDDVVNNHLPVCVWFGTVTHSYMRNNYPDALVVEKLRGRDMYQGLRNGECTVALVGQANWFFDEVNEEINGDCKLTWVGRPVNRVSAGFVTQADYRDMCSSLINDVVNIHLEDMRTDGTLDILKNRAVQFSGSVNCALEGSTNENGSEDDNSVIDSMSLDMYSMAGTFSLHAVLSVIAILVGCIASKVKKINDNDTSSNSSSFHGDSSSNGSSNASVLDAGCIDASCDEETCNHITKKSVVVNDTCMMEMRNELIGKIDEQSNTIDELKSYVAEISLLLKTSRRDDDSPSSSDGPFFRTVQNETRSFANNK